MKKKDYLLYALLIISTLLAIYLVVRTSSLQAELSKTKAATENLNRYIDNHKRLLEIDSIVMKGDYDKAIDSYSATLNTDKDLNMGIPLRIALAKKLKENNAKKMSNTPNGQMDADSLLPNAATPQEIRSLDSLSFALEKARVQLGSMRKQLIEKSLGEYMSFTSKKGTALHYVGEVNNKMANGTGIALLETGSRYEGQWKNNQREGEGTFYWPDGEYYVGHYEDDMRNGEGSYFWPNGDKYVGQWKDDKRNGKGSFFNADGSVVNGNWVNDKLQNAEKPEKKQK